MRPRFHIIAPAATAGSVLRVRLEYVAAYLSAHPLLDIHFSVVTGSPGGIPADRCLYYGSSVVWQSGYYVPAHSLSGAYTDRSWLAGWEMRPLNSPTGTVHVATHRTAPGMSGALFERERCTVDVFGSLLFWLGQAEAHYAPATELDAHGRLREDRQLLVRSGLEHRPVVDRLVVAFARGLGIAVPDRPTRISTSHDIDMLRQFPTPYRYLRTSLRTLLKDRSWTRFRTVQRIVYDRWRGRRPDPFDTFDWLLRVPGFERHRIYFLLGGKTAYDGYYSPRHPALASIYRLARTEGYTIGIHPSYASYRDGAMIESERALLRQQLPDNPVTYSRQHWLRLRVPDTWRALAAAGIRRDASLGFAARYGFRAGTGFAFVPYDLEHERPHALCVEPLVIMDVGLLVQAGQRVDRAAELLDTFLKMNAFNTHISLNFHNSIFDETLYDATALRSLYEGLGQWSSRSGSAAYTE